MPLTVNLLHTPQQETSQAPAVLDLSIHRLHDRLALSVDIGALLASELAGHAVFDIGIRGDRAAFRWWRLAVRQPAGGDVRVDALISTGLGVLRAPVAPSIVITSSSAPAIAATCCNMGSSCSTSGGRLLTPTATIT